MTHQVNVNGVIHEFPDEATPEMMQEALSQNSSIESQSNPLKDLWMATYGNLPKEPALAPFMSKESFVNPEIIKEGINAAGGLPGMEVIGARTLGVTLPQLLKQSGILGVTGAAITPGGIEDRAKGALEGAALPFVPEAVKLGVKTAVVPFKLIGKAVKKISPLQKYLEEATKSSEQAAESERLAKESAKQELGKSDYAVMEHNLNENRNKLNEINKTLEKDIPSPESYLLDTPEESEKRLLNSKISQRKAEDQAKLIENQISYHLESGKTHDVKTAELMQKDINNLKDEGTNLFEEVKDNVKNKGVIISNSRSAKEINDDLSKLLQSGKERSKEGSKLIRELDLINQKDVIPADEYMSAIKSVKGYMRDAYSKAYEPGINEEKRVFYKNQADEAKSKLEEMNNVLEKSIGKEDFDKLLEANDYWRKNIIPLYDEPIYWKIMKNKLISKNMASDLRGGNPGSGKEIIRNLIKNNPQALKHVVGQVYDSNALLVHEPNELISEYTDLMPDLKGLINNKKQAQLLADKASQRSKLHETFRNESNRLNKSYQTELKNISNLRSQKEDLEKTISLMEKHIPELRQASEDKRLSLKEKIEAKHRLKRAEMLRDKARRKLYIAGGALISAVGIPYGIRKIGGLFSNE